MTRLFTKDGRTLLPGSQLNPNRDGPYVAEVPTDTFALYGNLEDEGDVPPASDVSVADQASSADKAKADFAAAIVMNKYPVPDSAWWISGESGAGASQSSASQKQPVPAFTMVFADQADRTRRRKRSQVDDDVAAASAKQKQATSASAILMRAWLGTEDQPKQAVAAQPHTPAAQASTSAASAPSVSAVSPLSGKSVSTGQPLSFKAARAQLASVGLKAVFRCRMCSTDGYAYDSLHNHYTACYQRCSNVASAAKHYDPASATDPRQLCRQAGQYSRHKLL